MFFWREASSFERQAGMPVLLLHRAIELVGELWIQLLQDCEFTRHAILIVEAGIDKTEAVVGLRKRGFLSTRFFERSQSILIFSGFIAGVPQRVISLRVGRIKADGFIEGLGRIAELARAETRRAQVEPGLLVIGLELRRALKRFGSLGETAGVKERLAQVVMRHNIIRVQFN